MAIVNHRAIVNLLRRSIFSTAGSFQQIELDGDCSEIPYPYNVSEKYWRYTSNLYCSTPPICNAVPRWLLSFGERETPQYTSNLCCSTPPIGTAVRFPFVPAILLRKYQGLGVPESS